MKRKELKAIVAIILVLTTMFALASIVSAEFVDRILNIAGEKACYSSGDCTHPEAYRQQEKVKCPNCQVEYVKSEWCSAPGCGQYFLVPNHVCNTTSNPSKTQWGVGYYH